MLFIIIFFLLRRAKNRNILVASAPPRGFPAGTKFAEEFPRERGTSFRRICELDPVQRVARCRSELVSDGKKAGYPFGYPAFLEAPPRFGLGVEVLQTFALPLGHGAIFFTTYGLYHKDFSLSIAKSKYFCLFINKKALPVGSAKLFYSHSSTLRSNIFFSKPPRFSAFSALTRSSSSLVYPRASAAV